MISPHYWFEASIISLGKILYIQNGFSIFEESIKTTSPILSTWSLRTKAQDSSMYSKLLFFLCKHNLDQLQKLTSNVLKKPTLLNLSFCNGWKQIKICNCKEKVTANIIIEDRRSSS